MYNKEKKKKKKKKKKKRAARSRITSLSRPELDLIPVEGPGSRLAQEKLKLLHLTVGLCPQATLTRQ
jgi:hypothetical protein